MRIGSLFSGIGGLELGLERAGVGHTVWQVEKDEFCRRVLAKHWPDAAQMGDITEIDWENDGIDYGDGIARSLHVDVICGGFPCQDISLAGKGAGLAGERSGLWREYLRAIRELRPRYVVVENVAALLARGLGDVLGDLAESGYDTEWDCVPAAAVGAPHRRDRLFVLAYPQRDGLRVEPEPEPGGSRALVSVGYGPSQHVADPDNAGRHEQRGPVADAAEQQAVERGGWWGSEPDVGRVAHGVPSRVDRLRALGNAVVPQVAEVVGRRLMELERAA